MPPGDKQSDRLTRAEVIADTLRSDISELKHKLESLDDEVSELNTSQKLQLKDLENIKQSLGSLEATIKTMTSTVKKAEQNRALDFDLEKSLTGITIAKVKSYFMIGMTIAGVIYGILQFSAKAIKTDSHLLDHAHAIQEKALESK